MALLKLHARLNPERLVLQERTEIAAVDAYLDGSVIYSKGGVQLFVKETPEDILSMMEGQ